MTLFFFFLKISLRNVKETKISTAKMSSLHVYYKRELHLVCWGPHWPICFLGVWDCLVQVLTPFTHPKRVERNRLMQVHCSFVIFKLGNVWCSRKWFQSTAWGHIQHSQLEGLVHKVVWWLGVPSFLMFAQLLGSKDGKNAAQQTRAMAIPCWGQGVGMA